MGQHLVVGARDGFFGSSAKIWVVENDEFVEVTVMEVD